MTNELALCRTFVENHTKDAARTLERLPVSPVAALLEAMPAAVAAQVLLEIVPTLGSDCLGRMAPSKAAALLAEMPAGYAVVLLRRIEPAKASAVLEQMAEDEVRLLSTMLTYPADCAGALMDSRVFAATESLRVAHVLDALRKLPPQLHDYVFVVDDEHRLIGVVPLQNLLCARRTELLKNIMNRAVSRLPARTRRAAVVNHPGWRQFHTLPVVDDAGVLVGAVEHSTVRAIFEQDALGHPSRADAVTTVFALGELYWLGLSGVLDGVVSAVGRLAPTNVGVGSGEVRHGGH